MSTGLAALGKPQGFGATPKPPEIFANCVARPRTLG
jgi:hypothetical protein